MIFIINFKQLNMKTMNIQKYSLYLNELRKNLASSASCSCVALPPTIPVGDLDRSPLMRSYGYASAGDQPTLFAIFSLTNSSGANLNSFAGPKGEGQDARSNFVPFMQYAG